MLKEMRLQNWRRKRAEKVQFYSCDETAPLGGLGSGSAPRLAGLAAASADGGGAERGDSDPLPWACASSGGAGAEVVSGNEEVVAGATSASARGARTSARTFSVSRRYSRNSRRRSRSFIQLNCLLFSRSAIFSWKPAIHLSSFSR